MFLCVWCRAIKKVYGSVADRTSAISSTYSRTVLHLKTRRDFAQLQLLARGYFAAQLVEEVIKKDHARSFFPARYRPLDPVSGFTNIRMSTRWCSGLSVGRLASISPSPIKR